MAQCDETTLESLSSDVLDVSLHDLLKESLPACMVLILTSYTEQSRGGGEEGGASERERQLASRSHDLLTKILSEEVIFVVYLDNLLSVHFVLYMALFAHPPLECTFLA